MEIPDLIEIRIPENSFVGGSVIDWEKGRIDVFKVIRSPGNRGQDQFTLIARILGVIGESSLDVGIGANIIRCIIWLSIGIQLGLYHTLASETRRSFEVGMRTVEVAKDNRDGFRAWVILGFDGSRQNKCRSHCQSHLVHALLLIFEPMRFLPNYRILPH